MVYKYLHYVVLTYDNKIEISFVSTTVHYGSRNTLQYIFVTFLKWSTCSWAARIAMAFGASSLLFFLAAVTFLLFVGGFWQDELCSLSRKLSSISFWILIALSRCWIMNIFSSIKWEKCIHLSLCLLLWNSTHSAKFLLIKEGWMQVQCDFWDSFFTALIPSTITTKTEYIKKRV